MSPVKQLKKVKRATYHQYILALVPPPSFLDPPPPCFLIITSSAKVKQAYYSEQSGYLDKWLT